VADVARRGRGGSLLWVTAAYAALTVVMTWPLTPGLARDVPGDLGDSLLNLWILGWGAENVPRVLTGRLALRGLWDANIFHPEPLALAFSEHLFGEVLQILPLHAITGNLILAYNLIFLSSFVLSGLGMYVLVRELLGERGRFSWPAFAAGLIYAFVPFRIAQVAHIQSVNSQWMPFVLYGFRRFIVPPAAAVSPRRYLPLALGAAALLMQNWSCGYYLIFFAPFVALFVVHQMAAANRIADWRAWTAFAVAAIVVAAGTWPFLSLYLDAQRVHGFERSLGEVIRFSADVYSYVTAPEALRLWGSWLQVYPKPEGELFFGLVPWVLFAIGGITLARLKPGRTTGSPVVRPGISLALRSVRWILLIQLLAFVALLLTGGFVTSIAGIPIRATNPSRVLAGIAVTAAVLLALSRDARERAVLALRSPLALAIALALLACWLSLGPRPQSFGRPLQGLGLYGVFYDHVPGFDGLRVPARYAMLAALFVSIAAGLVLGSLPARRARAASAVAALLFLIEAAFVPMTVNATWGDSGVQPPPRVMPVAAAPELYRELAAMPDVRVLAEFPFGDPAWELRYVYYSTVHWKRLINGYSGAFPRSYRMRAALFARVGEDPDAAWRALRDAAATHVIVHRDAMPPAEAGVVESWLSARGARIARQAGGDVLYALPPSP
jgi:hypothetical protein